MVLEQGQGLSQVHGLKWAKSSDFADLQRYEKVFLDHSSVSLWRSLQKQGLFLSNGGTNWQFYQGISASCQLKPIPTNLKP